MWGKLPEDKDVQIYFNIDSQSLVLRMFSSWDTKGTFLMGNFVLILGRKYQVREAFLHVLFLKCLQLRIISMPKWHILK